MLGIRKTGKDARSSFQNSRKAPVLCPVHLVGREAEFGRLVALTGHRKSLFSIQPRRTTPSPCLPPWHLAVSSPQ
jgi:hypothetical protein